MAHNRLSRRRLIVFTGSAAVGVTASALLAACGAPASPTAAPPKPADAAAKPAAEPTKPAAAGAAPAPTTAPAAAKPATGGAGAVTLSFAHYLDPAAAKVYEGLTQNEWKQKFPSVDVKIDISPEAEFTGKMLTQMGGGSFQDVMMFTDRYLPDFAARDVLLDLNPNIKRDDAQYDSKDLNEDLIQSASWEGKWLGICDYTSPIVIYYNKRLFKEAGVEPPKEKGLSWTFDEFQQLSQKLTRGEGEKKVWASEGWGNSVGFQLYPFRSFGNNVLDHKGPAPAEKITWHWNTPEGKKALQYQTDLIVKDKTVPAPGAVQGDPFQAQRVAMKVTAGRWLAPLYASFTWAEDIGMLHQPLGTAPRQARNGPRGLMIPKGAKNQDQAWEFVKFITSKEGMQLLFKANYSIPARKSLWDAFATALPKHEDVEIHRKAQDVMSQIGAMPTFPKYAALNKVVADNVAAAWLGQQSVDDSLKKMDTEMNALSKAP
jgi:multiple sugar transport system substrate-binding protein